MASELRSMRGEAIGMLDVNSRCGILVDGLLRDCYTDMASTLILELLDG